MGLQPASWYPCTAGFDTSAAALAFTVYHIARTPRVERDMLAEVDAFGRAAAPAYEDLDQVYFTRPRPRKWHPAAAMSRVSWGLCGITSASRRSMTSHVKLCRLAAVCMSYDVLLPPQFPYLDAVFSEALRMTPPGAFGTIRVAREDFTLGGYKIRKGWLLNVRLVAACSLQPPAGSFEDGSGRTDCYLPVCPVYPAFALPFNLR